MDFETRYKKLNTAQREAVDTIDGPVMVIAGPGTGKTELLGMRAANILKQTDALPENILCLTFTEAGSVAMKKRLTDIIGRDAYNVSVHTFHAFGSDVMNRYREYFNNGADFKPADDLARHRIVTEILDSLEYNDPLRSSHDGHYTATRDVIAAISDLKRAGLTNGEFVRLLDAMELTISVAGKLLTDVFSSTVTKTTRDSLAEALEKIQSIDEDVPLEGATPLRDVLALSLRHALDQAEAHPRVTPPITIWKNEWMTHAADKEKTMILKVQKNLPKLRSLARIYSLYLEIMSKAELYDYDDMIMNLVHAMEINADLRFDLQEKYQYIMVDEFQDTNMAQMRILHNLTNNPVVEDMPNILVVGDDDQAIYGFQGAEIGNILTFEQQYPNTKHIALTDNYRSTQQILDCAREVISQGTDRLETVINTLDKTLTAKSDRVGQSEIIRVSSTHEERCFVADSIKKLIDGGTSPSEIAIIARKHDDLVSLIGYLADQAIPISYDRRENVLDDEVIIQLEHLGKIIVAINQANHTQANALLPELLSHPAWGIKPVEVWEISLAANKNRQQWLEAMRDHSATKPLFDWLMAAAGQSQQLPLERMLDILIGVTQADDTFCSPLKEYFFGSTAQADASSFTAHLKNLTAIRTALREHLFEDRTPLLADFLDFIAENRATNTRITTLRHVGEDGASVQLLSAHGSKGLEFEHVFVINATDSMWGQKASGRTPQIIFPPHLRLRQYADDYNERLRLFFVAMTRAKNALYISYADENDSAKELLPAAFLVGNSLPLRQQPDGEKIMDDDASASQVWYAPVANIPAAPMRDFLLPVLQNYKLSATHVNNFLDVTHGGPKQFLLDTLLRFPHERGAAASYGSAVHEALQKAHNHVRATGQLQPEEDILHEFEKIMDQIQFTDIERRHYVQQGTDALSLFLRKKHADFRATQQAELDFSNQDAYVDDVHLTGKLDVVEFDRETMSAVVIDYKTGGALTSWDKGDAYQKIKAHKYRQQLLFYKLLIEHSRDWRQYHMAEGILQFVEPDQAGSIIDLRLGEVSPEELDHFTRLIQAIWRNIHDLSFPDTSGYEPTINGIKQFEEDLLTDSIK